MSALLHGWQRLMLPQNHLHVQQPATRMIFIQREAKLGSTSDLGFSAKKSDFEGTACNPAWVESHKGKEKKCLGTTFKLSKFRPRHPATLVLYFSVNWREKTTQTCVQLVSQTHTRTRTHAHTTHTHTHTEPYTSLFVRTFKSIMYFPAPYTDCPN